MASAPLLRSLPLRSIMYRAATTSAAAVIAAAFTRRYLSALSDETSSAAGQQPAPVASTNSLAEVWINSEGFKEGFNEWKDKKAEMLSDIQPTMRRTKEILHSDRYSDGSTLSKEDEELVIEKLLVHHPHAEDKIGCGLQAIMVDTHPRFINSRCLFVVRTDGGWIDFSYQKCLVAYIRKKYPTYAERFIREHFKRSLKSGY